MDGLPGAARLDEGHHLAFVVTGAARQDHLAAGLDLGEARLERRAVPEVQRVDGLHVVMPVEEEMRAFPAILRARLLRMPEDDRMALGRAHAGVKADRGDIRLQMLGGGDAMLLVGRIRRDRRNAQEGKEALDRCVEILIEMGKDFIEL